MFIAHLPLGYLITKAVVSRGNFSDNQRKHIWYAGLIGSIAPDFDMFYFYLIDNQQHNHHSYITHMPVFWLGVLVVLGVVCRWLYDKYLPMIGMFSLTLFAHLLADSLVGGILWLYPFIDTSYVLFIVPNIHSHWLLNFILHWSFAVELCIVFVALFVYWSSKPSIAKS